MYAVILAGGGGTRLWPLSTPDRPKPFLPLLGDRSLLQLTADRLAGLVDADAIFVVADRRHSDLVRAQLPAATVVEEPLGRNTAAAIALAAAAIARPADEVMVVLPADHRIAREAAFRDVLRDAAGELAGGAFGIAAPLVTLGIQVTRPSTGYGYLIPDVDRRLERQLTAYPLLRFQEKPDHETAQRLLAMPGVAWNAGMFLWRREVILDALASHAPDILEPIARALAASTLGDAYPEIRSTSIDYAVMEPASLAGEVVMGAMDVGWSDLGSWDALLADLGADEVVGRIVQAGETAAIGPAAVVVQRHDGRLAVAAGPGTIADEPGPSALLEGAAPRRAVIDALVARVTAAER
ncbi:MAG TPA: mannose-1-phosphate guanylyltransferase [Candidatus Limnocylindrales bacterium]